MGKIRLGELPRKVIFTVVLIGLLCALPVSLLIHNIVQSSGAESLSSAETLGDPQNDYFSGATPVYSSAASHVCVAFEFLGFDPSTSYASFAMAISEAKANEGYIQHELDTGYSAGVLVIRSYFGLDPIVVPFPLVDLTTGVLSDACTTGSSARYNHGVGFRAQESSYMLGQPRAFPMDWYELDDTISVYLCPRREAQNKCAARLNLQSELDMGQLGTPSVI